MGHKLAAAQPTSTVEAHLGQLFRDGSPRDRSLEATLSGDMRSLVTDSLSLMASVESRTDVSLRRADMVFSLFVAFVFRQPDGEEIVA